MRCKGGMLGAARQKGWDISRSTFASSFDLSVNVSGTITGIEFGDNGFGLYVAESVTVGGSGSTGKLLQYSLSTPYSITTATFVRSVEIEYSFTPSGNKQVRQASALTIKPDGSVVYVASSSSPKAIQQYNLSTPYDISTMSYLQRLTYAEGAGTAFPTDVQFSGDGSRMFIASDRGDVITSYTLSTAWDISTATQESTLSVSSQQTQMLGMTFRPSGLQLFICGGQGDKITEYSLSTAWDITSASYVQQFVQSSDAAPRSLRLRPDGTEMFFSGSFSNNIYEYALA